MTKKASAVCAAVAVLALVGCGGGKVADQDLAPVSGTITLDKKPISSGRIVFDATNGQPPSSLSITDGKYEGKAPVGKCKVMISSIQKMTMKEKARKDGQKVLDGPGYDEMVEDNILPERYNTKSEIMREVEAGKPNTINFDLESKK
ncbi:MAG: hypothetical protein MUF18_05880 [Fimbriiglobus sp.]|jgi:hypothetical protein|nr:hypothetical protein [Fimbriiglobus sp.]